MQILLPAERVLQAAFMLHRIYSNPSAIRMRSQMTAGNKTVANRIMDIGLQSLFILFPASCASVALYDVWLQGMSSPIAIVALGIAGIFFAAKLAVLGFAAADAAMDASRLLAVSTRRRWNSVVERLSGAIAFSHGGKLSQA
jgi:hypothetical protein